MSRSANPSVIGAFVLGAVGLAVAAVLIFGSGRMFEQINKFVLYFDSSVEGLDVGAPVIFQGVEVGTVTRITALVNVKTGMFTVPVHVELVTGRVQILGVTDGDTISNVQSEIKRGLRARLKSLSLITGKLYVDLDYYPDKPAKFVGLEPGTPEIPTIPSELEEIRATAAEVIKQIRALPLTELVDRLASSATSLDELLKKPELDDAIDELDGTLTQARSSLAEVETTFAEARVTLGKVNARVDPLADSAQGALDEARSALVKVEEAVGNINGLVEPGSPLNYELVVALEELTRAARSIRVLADGLSQQPDAIIFGKGQSRGQ